MLLMFSVINGRKSKETNNRKGNAMLIGTGAYETKIEIFGTHLNGTYGRIGLIRGIMTDEEVAKIVDNIENEYSLTVEDRP